MKADHDSEAAYLSGPDNDIKIKALKVLVKMWGGSLTELDEETFSKRAEAESWALAPFTHSDLGVDYAAKAIYYSKGTPWPHIVHDMGHVFACLEAPEESEEYAFFGWEWTIAQNLNGIEAYLLFNRDYSVGDGDDLGSLKPLELLKVVAERIGKAYALGLVNNGAPQPLR